MPTLRLNAAQNNYCFSLQLRIANAANGQITKRDKLDVFRLSPISTEIHMRHQYGDFGIYN